jgi:hypothetical protein
MTGRPESAFRALPPVLHDRELAPLTVDDLDELLTLNRMLFTGKFDGLQDE